MPILRFTQSKFAQNPIVAAARADQDLRAIAHGRSCPRAFRFNHPQREFNVRRDDFFWLSEINKATVAVSKKAGLIDERIARLAAGGIAAVEKAAAEDPAKRVKKYIAYEPMLIAATTPEITIIHAGRSSQDILSTVRLAMMRDEAVAFGRAFDAVLEKLLALADAHRDTIVPNYTNGVAAQPNSYAHYLLGFAASFLRERERLAQCMKRFNKCPMGATVLNGTCWPLDREGMAEALGFDEPLRNAFDCTCEAPVDFPLELAAIAGATALHVSSMICDIMVQYAQPRPWIMLEEGGENTYVSSAMPQKRNPGLMNNCRTDASNVLGEMSAAYLRAHNLVPGMVDGKSTDRNGRMMQTATAMLGRFLKVLNALRINPARALEELNSDWTASQEIADRLMRDHGLPFRIGHHMASRMVSWARANNVLPLDFPYAEMQRIYKEEIEAEYPEASTVLPMSEAEFRDALDPRKIVANRRTAGSAAPQEVDAMIAEDRAALAGFKTTLDALDAKIAASLEALDHRFAEWL